MILYVRRQVTAICFIAGYRGVSAIFAIIPGINKYFGKIGQYVGADGIITDLQLNSVYIVDFI